MVPRRILSNGLRQRDGGGPRRAAPVVAALILTPLAGCTEVPPAGMQQLAGAEQKYRNEQYDAARQDLDGFLKAYPRHNASPEAYYLRALCMEQANRKSEAAADLKQCIAQSKNPVLTAKAHAMAGALDQESGDVGGAMTHFEQALKGLGDKPPADMVHWRYGVALQRQGDWAKAREHFGAVLQKFPGSQAADQARRMHDWKDDFFSIQCGAFRDVAGAQQLAAKLKSAGLDARVEQRSRSGEVLQTVCVGKYPTYAAALDALARVKQHEAGATVVP